MEVTYQRDVSHCEVSPYIKMVTIKRITDAINSDSLDSVQFIELGWNAVTQRGQCKPGDKVMFIPAESVLPFELSEELNITKYLSNGRLRSIKLRGNRSEGLIVLKEKVEKYLPYIMKWEDKPTVHMQGDALAARGISPHFIKFYKMPNILNEPDIFNVGEKVIYSEKIHGTNTRFGLLRHPHTDEYCDYVGSHNMTLKESDANIYWQIYKQIFQNNMPKDMVFFAEIFGPGIQQLHYNRKEIDVKVFAATVKGEYINPTEVRVVCDEYGLPCVKFNETVFSGNIEQFRDLADEPSVLTEDYIREGVVIVSKDQPEKMAKCVGFRYTTSKKRTERH